MGPDFWFSIIKDEWNTIMLAKIVASAIFCSGAIIFFLITKFAYRREISNLKTKVDLIDAQKFAYTREISNLKTKVDLIDAQKNKIEAEFNGIQKSKQYLFSEISNRLRKTATPLPSKISSDFLIERWGVTREDLFRMIKVRILITKAPAASPAPIESEEDIEDILGFLSSENGDDSAENMMEYLEFNQGSVKYLENILINFT